MSICACIHKIFGCVYTYTGSGRNEEHMGRTFSVVWRDWVKGLGPKDNLRVQLGNS